jgi:hypothetical protein
MGYRLEVAEVEPEYKICGGKLYGYYGLVQAGNSIVVDVLMAIFRSLYGKTQ